MTTPFEATDASKSPSPDVGILGRAYVKVQSVVCLSANIASDPIRGANHARQGRSELVVWGVAGDRVFGKRLWRLRYNTPALSANAKCYSCSVASRSLHGVLRTRTAEHRPNARAPGVARNGGLRGQSRPHQRPGRGFTRIQLA